MYFPVSTIIPLFIILSKKYVLHFSRSIFPKIFQETIPSTHNAFVIKLPSKETETTEWSNQFRRRGPEESVLGRSSETIATANRLLPRALWSGMREDTKKSDRDCAVRTEKITYAFRNILSLLRSTSKSFSLGSWNTDGVESVLICWVPTAFVQHFKLYFFL